MSLFTTSQKWPSGQVSPSPARALSILAAPNPIALVGLVRETPLRESWSCLAIYDSSLSRGYRTFANGLSTPSVHDDLALSGLGSGLDGLYVHILSFFSLRFWTGLLNPL